MRRCAVTVQSRRAMTPQDITRIRFISDPQISPDGRLVAFVVTRLAVDERCQPTRPVTSRRLHQHDIGTELRQHWPSELAALVGKVKNTIRLQQHELPLRRRRSVQSAARTSGWHSHEESAKCTY